MKTNFANSVEDLFKGRDPSKEKLEPAMLFVWEGDDIIKTTREMIAAKNPSEVAAGTYKCSDSIKAANREIALAFTPEEMVEFRR